MRVGIGECGLGDEILSRSAYIIPTRTVVTLHAGLRCGNTVKRRSLVVAHFRVIDFNHKVAALVGVGRGKGDVHGGVGAVQSPCVNGRGTDHVHEGRQRAVRHFLDVDHELGISP